MALGDSYPRLMMRELDWKAEDYISGLGGKGVGSPTKLDCERILPVLEMNQGGMADPRTTEIVGDLQKGSFTHCIYIEGAGLALASSRAATIIGPSGFAAGADTLSSVNGQVPTRNQNTLVNMVGGFVNFDGAGAAAFAGKTVTVFFRYYHCEAYALNGALYAEIATYPMVINAALVYYWWGGQVNWLVPWDCALVIGIRSDDGTNFPANTATYGIVTVMTRPKNSPLPQWG